MTLDEVWQEMSARFIKDGCPVELRRYLKHCFFLGADTMMHVFLLCCGDDIPAKCADEKLQALASELREYVSTVKGPFSRS